VEIAVVKKGLVGVSAFAHDEQVDVESIRVDAVSGVGTGDADGDNGGRVNVLDDSRFEQLLITRAEHPERVEEAAAIRPRRPVLTGDKRLVIIAVDHPARRSVGVGDQPMIMGNRRQLLENTIGALRRPGVDGILASPDILEDLLLLGELDNKVCIGSMNRGGLLGSSWELDDRFTAYDAEAIERLHLEGGKMLLRINDDDRDSVKTLESCAQAVGALADRKLMALVEPLPVYRDKDGVLRVSKDPDELNMAVGVASSLGSTSAYSWLKLPAPSNPELVLAATTLPTLLLGGDPGQDPQALFAAWERALRIPNVRGLVAGRSLVFPVDGDVGKATDTAVALVHGSMS
jgi:hypothetical protein